MPRIIYNTYFILFDPKYMRLTIYFSVWLNKIYAELHLLIFYEKYSSSASWRASISSLPDSFRTIINSISLLLNCLTGSHYFVGFSWKYGTIDIYFIIFITVSYIYFLEIIHMSEDFKSKQLYKFTFYFCNYEITFKVKKLNKKL